MGSAGERVKNVLQYGYIMRRDSDPRWVVDPFQPSQRGKPFLLLYDAEISPWHGALVQPPLNLARLYHDTVRAYVQCVVTGPTGPVFRSSPLQLTKVELISTALRQQNQRFIKCCSCQQLNTSQAMSQHTIEM